MDRDEDLDLSLPERFREDLRSRHRAPPVPGRVDRAVLAVAHETLGRVRGDRWARRWWGAAAAAAALVAGALLVDWRPAPHRPALEMAAAPAIAGDLDGSGRIDILDAFWLARALRDGRPTRGEWDETGDGRVDRADVDALAMRAVR